MLDNFFTPKSIALIGASHEETKLGYQLLKNLIDGGYKGKIYPINPDTTPILNLEVFDSILKISDTVDLALICVKANIVPEIIKEIAKKGVKSIIIYTAGFEEIGVEGKKLEEEIKYLAINNDLKILGPNCLGLLSRVNNLNASFSANFPKDGKTAILSQSGALLTSMLDWAEKNSFGISHGISLGNKMDLTEMDFLKYLEKDENTKQVGLYLESFADGIAFQRLASEISLTKPIIVLKPGRSDQAKIAVTSHTGALAGSDEATEAALRQSGCIRANTIEEFYDLLKAFSGGLFPKGPELAIITNAGGPGVIATDKAMQEGLNIINIFQNVKNPLDVIGDALADKYQKALQTVLADKIQDAVLVILTPQSMTQIGETAKIISDLSKLSQKPVFASFIGGEKVEEGIKILNKNNIPVFPFPENAVSALKSLLWYIEKKKSINLPVNNLYIEENNRQKAKAIFCKYQSGSLSTADCFEIAEIYEIPAAKIYSSNDISFPVVLKIDTQTHKNKIGGVIKNINNREELDASIRKLSPLANKFIIQEQVKEGIEVIIGAKKDKDFGHLIMFGMGGIYTESLKDINFAVSPLSNFDALDLVKNTKVYNIISKNIFPIIKCLLSVSTLLSDFPQIQELDINPLIVHEKSAIAVDIKIKV